MISPNSNAQTSNLPSEAQQILNSLPPMQRQLAINKINEYEKENRNPKQSTIEETQLTEETFYEYDESNNEFYDLERQVEPKSRLIINFQTSDLASNQDLLRIEKDLFLKKLLGSHYLTLDDSGVLFLEGLEGIPLLGLTEDDISLRLMAEPVLSLFSIEARILNQEPIGIEALKPFGYEVFNPDNSILQDEANNGPAPSNYVLGPGDLIRVQLFGNVNDIYEYEVSRDGSFSLPEIGPLIVAGLTFQELRAELNKLIQEAFIGTQASITLGQLKTINVYVLGDVIRPGSVIVNGLQTMVDALYKSGGISPIGTLRNIQLKRDGNVISSLDAYDLLVQGDMSGNSRLQAGDVIFVPPVGKVVSITGAVKRPAIYEVKKDSSLLELVSLAGGLTPEASPDEAKLERIDGKSQRHLISVNLNDMSASKMQINTGDVLLIPEVTPNIKNIVELSGHVHRPGNYPWYQGMKITDLLRSIYELKDGADSNYILIRREEKFGGQVTALSADLSAALESPGGESDVELKSGDKVSVVTNSYNRQSAIQNLVNEIELQATSDSPAQKVSIAGSVRSPGDYPFEFGMQVSDLIRAGGYLSYEAYTVEAELTRSLSLNDIDDIEIININLQAIISGDKKFDFPLKEGDEIFIKSKPSLHSNLSISLEGEVNFPGNYRFKRGESLNDVIRRAGGFTDFAYPQGLIFLRESIKEKEKEQISDLIKRAEADIAQQSINGSESVNFSQDILDKLNNFEAIGRLVVDLNNGLSTSDNIFLEAGDRILIPNVSQTVTVIGEAQQNTSHIYRPGLTRNDYIDLSGGLSRRADKKLIYVVRANGEVNINSYSKWFVRKRNIQIMPGDTIIIPTKIDTVNNLTLWTNVTQIVYQGAVALAAIRRFN